MPVVRLDALLVLLLLACCPACAPERRADNLILVTVDTFRGDHFLETRGGVPLTPHLAEFARRAVVFVDVDSVGVCTSPGTAGILTGLTPPSSGVTRNSHMLPDELPTLATILRAEGFATAAFVSNPVLRPGMGFDNGFETYERLAPLPGMAKTRAARISEAGLRWLDALPEGERFFLWLHYMEPHGPYEPGEEFHALFPREEFDAPQEIPLLDDNSGLGGIPRYQRVKDSEFEADGREYLLRYAAEVRSLDHELDRLLGEFENRGLLARSAVVLTSDHGEALVDDHGFYFSHNNNLTRDQTRVPLLLYHPGCRGGTVLEYPVSTVDVVPTCVELLGVADPPRFDGTHLLSDTGRTLVYQNARDLAIREGTWQLVWQAKAGRYSLTDLAGDGADRVDVGADHPAVLKRLKERLDSVRNQAPLTRPTQRPGPPSKGAGG